MGGGAVGYAHVSKKSASVSVKRKKPMAAHGCSYRWRNGDKAIYRNDDIDISLPVTIIREVEGWWLVRCSDDSTAVVRPSRLIKPEHTNEKNLSGFLHR